MLPTDGRQTGWLKAIASLTRLVRSAIAAVVLLASISTLAMARQGDLTADRVLGQFDFTHNGTNILTNAGLSTPAAVAVDRSVVPNRLYVADMGNHRVLGWHSVDALKNGATADLVIGQQDFLSSIAQCQNAAVNGATLCSPSAIAVDGAGNLYVRVESSIQARATMGESAPAVCAIPVSWRSMRPATSTPPTPSIGACSSTTIR